MKKTFKIVGIIFGIIILLAGVIAFNGWRNMKKLNLSREKADYIIANLDDPHITEKFPVKYFPKGQLDPLLKDIRDNCDWKNKDGKFVDFFYTKNVGGDDQTALIYEYYLKCDSLRFIFSFNMVSNPELIGLHIEPLELENRMILFPEKQLKNRR